MKNQNFISADGKTAKNSYGEYFEVGDKVKHEDSSVGEAKINRFEIDGDSNEIKAHTDKGWSHIDFITK